MSVASELSRLGRDLDSLEEEITTTTGPRAKVTLSDGDRRKLRAEIQALIQRLDELAGRVAR